MVNSCVQSRVLRAENDTEGTVQVGARKWPALEVLRADGIRHSMPRHWLERFADAYALEMADWVDRMAGDQPPAVTGEDGIRAVALALAAQQSAQSGRPVAITLPPD